MKIGVTDNKSRKDLIFGSRKSHSEIPFKSIYKSPSLPKLLTPRKQFLNSPRKIDSKSGLTFAMAVLGPLPSIKFKGNTRDTFGESPILKKNYEDENSIFDIIPDY